jgi:hypothetical protein
MKYKHLRPKALTFMGRTYLVEFKEDLGDDLGSAHHEDFLIKVKEGQIPLEEADTLVHELLHVLWYHMGLCADLSPELEERVVRAMGTALTTAFQDNPTLMRYLNTTLKKEASC